MFWGVSNLVISPFLVPGKLSLVFKDNSHASKVIQILFFFQVCKKNASGTSVTLLLRGKRHNMVEQTREAQKKNLYVIGFIRFWKRQVNNKDMNV